ncbi:MAG: hypothetical protein HXS40_04985 [Theionarchaea archaeon]|nr:hypothetical protein [Theionarchaea archaeon]
MHKGEQKIRKINILTLAVLLLLAATSVNSSLSVVKVSTGFDALKDNKAPQVGVDGTGNSYLVWYGTSGDDQGIYWAKITEKGTVEKIIKASTYEDNQVSDDYDPHIAVDSEGNSYVVWYGVTRNDSAIYWAKIDPSGILEDVEEISTRRDGAKASARNPQIGIDVQGNSFVTWQAAGAKNQDIYFVRIDDSGVQGVVQLISTNKDSITYNDYNPQIAVDSEGNSNVVWYGYDGNDREIYWVSIDSTGTPGEVAKISTHVDNRDLDDYNPQIAVGPQANSYVVWNGFDGSDLEIYWVAVTAGHPGIVEKISTHQDNAFKNDYNPQIAVDSEGNSYVAWYGFDGMDDEIYWTRVEPSGSQEVTLKISTSPYNRIWDDDNPQIAADADGNSFVVWYGFDGTDNEIFWVRILASGTSGMPQIISLHTDNTNHNDYDPQIAVNNTNSYVVWYGFDGTSNEIYCTSFSSPQVLEVSSESSGPLTSLLSVTASQTPQTFILEAVVSDADRGSSIIRGAEYFLDVKGTAGKGTSMTAADGSFDSSVETVRAFIEVTGLTLGTHLVYVHGQDASGNWGPFNIVYFRIQRFTVE